MTNTAARAARCMAAFTVCLSMTGCVAIGALSRSPEGTGSTRTPTGESPAHRPP
jgi:hypothetical protein